MLHELFFLGNNFHIEGALPSSLMISRTIRLVRMKDTGGPDIPARFLGDSLKIFGTVLPGRS